MYIYPVEYYIAIKRKEIILLAAIWTGLGIIILSEGSKTGKDKYMRAYICGMWNLIFLKMIPVKSFTKQKQMYRYQKQTYGH